MLQKFSIEEILIRIMPGGFFLTIVYLIYGNVLNVNIQANLDFFYTFIFFCASYITGEILQTISHELEWIINLFFKLRKPSEIFLYKNNPVIKSDKTREEIIGLIKFSNEEIISKDYKEVSCNKWSKQNKEEKEISQSVFWKLYTQVSDTEEIKKVNSGYLFSRVITLIFLIISIMLFIKNINIYFLISVILFFIFLWRTRGYARGVVFKTVLLNLKK